MSTKFELQAEPREAKGTGASRRLRRQGQVPAVLYGAGKEPEMLSLSHDSIFHQIQNEAFFTSIVTVKFGGKTDQAIVRDLQMHPYKPRVQHVDLLRISATEKLHIAVPLHFVGGDLAPGVKQQGGIVSHLVTEVEVSCLPAQLPEFLKVDVSGLHIGESIHLSNLDVPEGVTLLALTHGNDLAVVTITMVRATVEAEERPAVEAPEAAPETKEAPKKEGK
ncbi:MAG TPA: 50S ribosomal protein L25/general stress protein Ctc [Acidiferrobacteraceae bacterium]|nr:50S ribosomal protein L25/general stress protein Ctc [Acidiferrobacteraceae bacterium]